MSRRNTADFIYCARGKPCALVLYAEGCNPDQNEMKKILQMSGNGWRVTIVHNWAEFQSEMESIFEEAP